MCEKQFSADTNRLFLFSLVATLPNNYTCSLMSLWGHNLSSSKDVAQQLPYKKGEVILHIIIVIFNVYTKSVAQNCCERFPILRDFLVGNCVKFDLRSQRNVENFMPVGFSCLAWVSYKKLMITRVEYNNPEKCQKRCLRCFFKWKIGKTVQLRLPTQLKFA